MIKFGHEMIYQAVVQDEVSPGLQLFGPSISVRLQGEEGWEGVLPGPFHHKAGSGAPLLRSVRTKTAAGTRQSVTY